MVFPRASTAAMRPACPEPDDALLVAATQADHRAFAPLYARYIGPVYRYCHARLRDREAAEDATSEIFVKALAAIPGYRDQVFAAWLFRIAHNVVVDAHRRRRPTEALTAAAEAPDPARLPDDLALSQVEREALWAAVAALPAEQRASVELQLVSWADGRIAVAIDRTPAAVRMLRLRALDRLRTALGPPG